MNQVSWHKFRSFGTAPVQTNLSLRRVEICLSKNGVENVSFDLALDVALDRLDEHVLQIQSCTCARFRKAWSAKQPWQRRLAPKIKLVDDVVDVVDEALRSWVNRYRLDFAGLVYEGEHDNTANVLVREVNGSAGSLRLSLSNGIFCKRVLEENIAEVERLGFENLEFNMKSVEVEDDVSVYDAKKLVDAHGLKCLTLHAATLHVKNEVEVHRAVYYGKISLEFARRLQAPVMVVHSNVSRKLPEPQRHKMLEAIFKELSSHAKSLNVKLALENLSYASSGYGKNVAELDEILGIADEEGAMGFTLDFCHAEATGQTSALLEKYHARLCNVHISNRAHKPFDSPTPSLLALVQKLREYGYAGPLTLELSRKCTVEEILKTKSVVEEILNL